MQPFKCNLKWTSSWRFGNVLSSLAHPTEWSERKAGKVILAFSIHGDNAKNQSSQKETCDSRTAAGSLFPSFFPAGKKSFPASLWKRMMGASKEVEVGEGHHEVVQSHRGYHEGHPEPKTTGKTPTRTSDLCSMYYLPKYCVLCSMCCVV